MSSTIKRSNSISSRDSSWFDLCDANSVTSGFTDWTGIDYCEEKEAQSSLLALQPVICNTTNSKNEEDESKTVASFGEPIFEESSFIEHVPCNSSNAWTDEETVKALRSKRFSTLKLLHGKRRWRGCFCRSCREAQWKVHVDRIDHRGYESLAPTNRNMQDNCKLYTITEFDKEMTFSTSLSSRGAWDYLETLLASNAVCTLTDKDGYGRSVEMYDLEVRGLLVDTKQTDATAGEILLDDRVKTKVRRNRYVKRFILKCRSQYYTFRGSRHHHIFPQDEWETIPHYVRGAGLPVVAPVDETREEYVAFQGVFHSRLTVQEAYTHLSGPMMRHANVTEEINYTARKLGWSYSVGTPQLYVSTTNHNHCWASTVPPTADYDDWHMEIDLGARHMGGRYVRAIVIQGRLPKLRSFPSQANFESRKDYEQYDGPHFAVVVEHEYEQQQWVELFNVQARSQKGAWFNLGVLRGNSNAMDQLRVELPAIHNIKIRHLRIQPLSKRDGGFHGAAPAFRVGIVALKQKFQGKHMGGSLVGMADVHKPKEGVPQGFVRYQVIRPQQVRLVEADGAECPRQRPAYVFNSRALMGGGKYRRSRKEQEKLKPSAKRELKSILMMD